MRAIRFVCLFAILISSLAQAQSNRARLANQPNKLSIAQQPQWGVHPNPSHMPQEARFTTHRARAFKASATQRGSSSSGLNFAPAVIYGSGGYNPDSMAVAVADVNGDGRADLLVANECGSSGDSCRSSGGVVGVLLGNGDGTFQPVVTYSSGGKWTSSVAVADVNGDGKPDLLLANEDSSNVSVLLGNGDGTFQAAVAFDSVGYGADSIAVADVNGDDKPDLLVANGCLNGDCRYGSVAVLLGNGDGTFQTAVGYGSGAYYALSVAVGDVNGDGKPDVVVANQCAGFQCSNPNGTVGVLIGNGDGTFQPAATYGSGGAWTTSVAVADVNADGNPDLLVTNACYSSNGCGTGEVGVLLGNGDGSFQTAVPYSSGGLWAMSVVVADVNGDGKPDLVVPNCTNTGNTCPSGDDSGGVAVLLGNGDGTFQPAVTYGSGGYEAFSAAVADVNKDGKPDLMLANNCTDSYCDTNGTVGVLINTSLTSTATSLVSSPNPSNFGQAVTFTATVTAQRGFYKGTPTGTVSFYDGTTNMGSSNLNTSGVATLTASTLKVGKHSITATYNGDANFVPSTSPVLYQVVQGAVVSLSPTHLNFGNETVGITSTPKVTTLVNMGNIALTITSIQVTGANSSDFAEKNNCGSSLPPKGRCKIDVTFTPTATGTRTAAVSITDNAPDSPQTVSLTGVGVLPAVMFSPTRLTFPTQLIFTTSPAQPVQLTNTGLGRLIIRKIVVGREFIQTNNCPKSIAPGASCTIDIKFHPINKGLLKADLGVVDNAPDSPQKVPLTGTGTFVKLTPARLKFGTQPVGTKSLPKRIAVTNKGDVAVNITKISITGADAGDFAETNNCGKQLASGASCFIKATFKPLVKGKRKADVSIKDDGGGSPQTVPLSGTGT